MTEQEFRDFLDGAKAKLADDLRRFWQSRAEAAEKRIAKALVLAERADHQCVCDDMIRALTVSTKGKEGK